MAISVHSIHIHGMHSARGWRRHTSASCEQCCCHCQELFLSGSEDKKGIFILVRPSEMFRAIGLVSYKTLAFLVFTYENFLNSLKVFYSIFCICSVQRDFKNSEWRSWGWEKVHPLLIIQIYWGSFMKAVKWMQKLKPGTTWQCFEPKTKQKKEQALLLYLHHM